MSKSKVPKTHFEQVPLEIVKKIAQEDPPDDNTNGLDMIIEPPARKCAAIPGLRLPTLNAVERPSRGRQGGCGREFYQ